jgi:hypothetical protein
MPRAQSTDRRKYRALGMLKAGTEPRHYELLND